MKKTTFILCTLTTLSSTALWADLPNQGLQAPFGETRTISGMANLTIPMRPEDVLKLPGMQDRTRSATASSSVLPVEGISDVINYPNPFDSRKTGLAGQTAIAYRLATDAHVTITIYTLFGDKVRSWDLANGQNGGRTGINIVYWDGTNEASQKVSKGGYIAQITVNTSNGTFTATDKIGVIH